VVDAKPVEGIVERLQQVAAGHVAAPTVGSSRRQQAARLARHHDVASIDDLRQQHAQDTLAVAGGVRVGRVDERAARVDECLQLVRRLVLVGVASPHRRTEADARDRQPRRPEAPLLHGSTVSGDHASRRPRR